MDSLEPAQRSWLMSRVKGRDTRPELAARRLLHRMGHRFRLHRKDLPGTPDIVLPKFRAVIFVHGCFWHRHDCANGRRLPKSRPDFWLPKLERNRVRDLVNRARLRGRGWRVLVVWECQLRDEEALRETLRNFLDEAWEDARERGASGRRR